jgi:hypothetical protein
MGHLGTRTNPCKGEKSPRPPNHTILADVETDRQGLAQMTPPHLLSIHPIDSGPRGRWRPARSPPPAGPCSPERVTAPGPPAQPPDPPPSSGDGSKTSSAVLRSLSRGPASLPSQPPTRSHGSSQSRSSTVRRCRPSTSQSWDRNDQTSTYSPHIAMPGASRPAAITALAPQPASEDDSRGGKEKNGRQREQGRSAQDQAWTLREHRPAGEEARHGVIVADFVLSHFVVS